MKKIFLAAVFLLIAGTMLAGSAFCQLAPWPEYCQERPAFTGGESFGYYIWHFHQAREWCIRTTTAGNMVVFEGNISSNNAIYITKRGNMEPDKGDYVTNNGPNQISFRLTTCGDEDGFDITTDGDYLIFNLTQNNYPSPVQNIFIGANNTNPPVNPIVINRVQY